MDWGGTASARTDRRVFDRVGAGIRASIRDVVLALRRANALLTGVAHRPPRHARLLVVLGTVAALALVFQPPLVRDFISGPAREAGLVVDRSTPDSPSESWHLLGARDFAGYPSAEPDCVHLGTGVHPRNDESCGDLASAAKLDIQVLYNRHWIARERRSKPRACRYPRRRRRSHSQTDDPDEDGRDPNEPPEDVGFDPDPDCRPEIVVMTTACNPYLEIYARMARAKGLGFRVLWAYKWGGWGFRARMFHQYLRTQPANKLFIISDALDVALMPYCDASELVAKYETARARQRLHRNPTVYRWQSGSNSSHEDEKLAGKERPSPPPILFTAEIYTWPDEQLWNLYSEWPNSPNK
ncbi:hypothetical protein HK405_016008 [Cladochytrium tenue]|nr:hypothetical protein HK405_016008 [Cladochytrium tenue]